MHIAVVVPCYRVHRQILEVLAAMPDFVASIHVVDDACPERSADLVLARCQDARVLVHQNSVNLGVGGAVMRGYREALEAGADIVVKIDGDGQMAPELLPSFLAPIVNGEADYTKGNRFHDLANIRCMPRTRIFGNAILSLMNKASSGYWDIFDPTNGYTAIHSDVLRRLPFEKISQRYFFESDMLFRLNLLKAVVVDIPMDARYGSETSSLRPSRVAGDFLVRHFRNGCRRIFYNYFLRDMSVASLQLVAGAGLMLAGAGYGAYHWIRSIQTGLITSPGTVMVAALPLLLGLQLFLGFLSYDVSAVPRKRVHSGWRGGIDGSHARLFRDKLGL